MTTAAKACIAGRGDRFDVNDSDEGGGAGSCRTHGRQPDAAGIRTLRSADLFADAREIVIDHCGDRYRLRCTSKGKLILTK